MAKLLLIGASYNTARGGDRGYVPGDAVHVVADGHPLGSEETPANGFICLELPGMSEEEALARYTRPKVEEVDGEPVVTGKRSHGLIYNQLARTIHPLLARYVKIQVARSRDSITAELENGDIVRVHSARSEVR